MEVKWDDDARRQRYEAWVKRKEEEVRQKAVKKKVEEEELKKDEEESMKKKEAERTKRMSYDAWLGGKQKLAKSDKDLINEVRTERRKEKEMMKKRVDTGLRREKSGARRLRQKTKSSVSLVLGGYVKKLVIDGWVENMGTRPEPQGCDHQESFPAVTSTCNDVQTGEAEANDCDSSLCPSRTSMASVV
eukprot:m.24832 g.24832  ORF g.24832 m.24832 type:complete len:189 (+) comp28682_c0_seq2:860-1426(+)